MKHLTLDEAIEFSEKIEDWSFLGIHEEYRGYLSDCKGPMVSLYRKIRMGVMKSYGMTVFWSSHNQDSYASRKLKPLYMKAKRQDESKERERGTQSKKCVDDLLK